MHQRVIPLKLYLDFYFFSTIFHIYCIYYRLIWNFSGKYILREMNPMPGFTTHYLFGLNTYKHLDNIEIKKILHKNHAAYSLGLQGPDVFFYFLPSYLIHSNNIGSVAHEERTGKFLHYLLKSRELFPDNNERQIAEAYIAGFLGHYVLDTHCHPYIYWKTRFEEKSSRYHGVHMRLEVDIDAELLQFYKHRVPSHFHQNTTIMLTSLQRRTIATVLHYAYAQTYPELHIWHSTMRVSIRSMQIGTRFLRDPSGKKKVFLRKLEGMILGYPLLSSMIPSDSLTFYLDPLNILHKQWYNPWDKTFTSTDSFFDLMEDAQVEYTSVLKKLSEIFSNNSSSEKECRKALLKQLGNNSYHSGLDTNGKC